MKRILITGSADGLGLMAAQRLGEGGHGGGCREPRRIETEVGLAHVFAINVLAPYRLTALTEPASRLVELSSGLPRRGDPELSDLHWDRRPWNSTQA